MKGWVFFTGKGRQRCEKGKKTRTLGKKATEEKFGVADRSREATK